jgi:hypothetical protein
MHALTKFGIATIAAALVGALTIAGPAGAFDLKAGTGEKLAPTKVQLGIVSPKNNVCPGFGKWTAWVQTNKPGKIDILLVRKGGDVYGPYPVTTVKGANGVILGSYTQALNVADAVDAQYRVVIPGSTLASNWAPLIADC